MKYFSSREDEMFFIQKRNSLLGCRNDRPKDDELFFIQILNSLPLSKLEKDVLKNYFGIDISEETRLTLTGIMDMYKLNRQQIEKLENKFLRSLRRSCGGRNFKLKDYLENGNICSIHDCLMEKEKVDIFYGLPNSFIPGYDNEKKNIFSKL